MLPPGGSLLSYYANESDYLSGKDAKGCLETSGATVFLKEVKGGVHRFTVQAAARELKLRAPSAADYDAWCRALRPYVSMRDSVAGDAGASSGRQSAGNPFGDDDDDD